MQDRREIEGIQYLRGIAAVAVVIDHAAGMTALPKYFGVTISAGFLQRGYIGVDLFFMISGFIISIVSLQKITLAPGSSILDFARRRFFRIVPMMWLAIVSYAVLRLVTNEFPIWNYALAMVAAPFGDLDPDIIWTLRHEFIFYILFAASFLNRHFVLRWLLLVWFLLPVVASIVGFAPNDQSILSQTIATLTHPANLEFGAGFLVGILWLRFSSKWMPKVPLLGLSCIAVFLLVWIVTFIWLGDLAPVWRSAALAASFLPLLVLCAHAVDKRISGWLMLLGSASFAIYLFHLHALSFVLIVLSKALPSLDARIVVLVGVTVSLAAGVAVHFLIERPLTSYMRRWPKTRVSSSLGEATS